MSKSFYLFSVLGLILTGCAKEKSYDEINKKQNQEFGSEHQPKDVIAKMCTTSDPCLYLASVAETPHEVTASRPFWQGEEKLVAFDIEKDNLKILQLVDDKRYEENINNLSPVLDIAISHIDYKCKTDEFDKCTNAEEEDADKPWDKRRYLKFDLANISILETNSLPIEFGELFESGCFSQTGQKATKFVIENDAINFTVRKSYKAAAKCAKLETMADLRYLAFSVNYTYSIVKLSSLVDSKYAKVDYPNYDKTTFGFFTTEKVKKSVDHHDHYSESHVELLNRFSPNKDEVVYYLSSEFKKPENQKIKQATVDVINQMNASLKEKGVSLKLALKQAESNSEIGDLRKNFLILVEDPQASGVIGYGPSVANPLTGETVNARTVMYLGTMQKFISRAYDEYVFKTYMENLPSMNEGAASNVESMNRSLHERLANAARYEDHSQSDDVELDKEAGKFAALRNHANCNHSMIDKLAQETFYHGSMVNFEGIVTEMLKDDFAKEGPKLWADLDDKTRLKYMDAISPIVFGQTLVHEIGHNLGLRHNFRGSVDQANYVKYTGHGGKEVVLPYSSVMDYGYATPTQSVVLAPYDLAALKFAYDRKVDTVSAQGVEELDLKDKSIADTIQSAQQAGKNITLKDYMFCTDGNVGSDILCNRFDSGTNYVEVLQHKISRYEDVYNKRNFRGRRYDMNSRSGDWSYLVATFNNFIEIRQFFNVYDQMASSGRFTEADFEANPFLKDVKDAADMSFNFFVNLVASPSYHCVELDISTGQVTKVGTFTEMVKATPLAQFLTFDIEQGCNLLNIPQYNPGGMGPDGRPTKVYGQFGKYLNNGMSPASFSPFAPAKAPGVDQIDVRGNYMDKVLASMFLAERFTSPTTTGRVSDSNYFDYKEYAEVLDKVIDSYLLNAKSNKEAVLTPYGTFERDVAFSMSDSQVINKSFNPNVNYILGLKLAQTPLAYPVMGQLKAGLIKNYVTDPEKYDKFSVKRLSVKREVTENFDSVIEFKELVKDATETEEAVYKVTHRFGAYSYNTKALELSSIKKHYEEIKTLGKEAVDKLVPLAIKVINAENQDEVLNTTIDEEKLNDDEQAALAYMLDVDTNVLDYIAKGMINKKSLLTSFIALTK